MISESPAADAHTLESSILKGIENGYWQNVEFGLFDSELQPNICEYLNTVNIAQEISRWRSEQKQNIDIRLEYSSEKFLQEAFPRALITGSVFDIDFISAETCNTRRPGRIDIILQKDRTGDFMTGKQSEVAIEVKGINPKFAKLMMEVNRLTEILLRTNATGANSVESCYITYLKRLDNPKKPFTGNDLKEQLLLFQNSIDSLKEHKAAEIRFQVIHKMIACKIAEEYLDGVFDQNAGDFPEYYEAANCSGAVMAVVIKLQRN